MTFLLRLVVVFIVLAQISCNSDKRESSFVRNVNISLIHDKDPVISEWLNSSLTPFKTQIAQFYPDSNIEITLSEEATTLSVENFASGKTKADGIILPHSGFSEIINSKIRNLGAAVSDCQDLIGSPYVAVIPKKQSAQLALVLGRSIENSAGPYISISRKELGSILNNSLYSYTHPKSSTTGQFSLLLSIAAISPEAASSSIPWNNATESIKSTQHHLEWYAASDQQAIKRLAAENSQSALNASGKFSLAIVALRQIHPEQKDALTILMPSDGTIWESHSLCISKADWVSPIKKSILLKFQQFLSSGSLLQSAKEQGFVQASSNGDFSPPAIKFSPTKSELSAEYSQKLQKPFSLAIAIDTSSSMQPDTINQLRDFSLQLLSSHQAGSTLDLLHFGSDVEVLGNNESARAGLDSRLELLTPGGGSAMYDAIAMQYKILSQKPSASTRKVALIVTDGNDKNSELSIEDLLKLIRNNTTGKELVSLNVVVVSPEQADLAPIRKIVEAANGILYESDLEKLPRLLHEIRESL